MYTREERREYMKQWRESNPDKEQKYREAQIGARKEYHRQYFQENKERLREQKQEYYHKHKEYFKDKSREHYERNKERLLQRQREMRLNIVKHYGAVCVCCGETTLEFLAIDHKNNDGNEQRKTMASNQVYRWIIENNYPNSIQILCHNCNMAKAFYGRCPHNRISTR